MRTALLTACLVASCGLVQSFSIHGGTVSTLTTPSASTRGIALSPAHALPLRSRVQARGFLTSLKAVTFEAQAPDPSVFVALGATVGAMLYWWQVLVPSERRGLGKEKYKGDTSEFLDKLAEAPEGDRGFEKWFYGEWLARRDRMLQMAAAKQASRRAREGGDLDEAQLQRDIAAEREASVRRADPLPAFFSFDNPVVVALTLVLFAVAFGGGR